MTAAAPAATAARRALVLALIGFFGSHVGRYRRLLGRFLAHYRIDHAWRFSGFGRFDGNSRSVRCGGFRLRCDGWLDPRGSFIDWRWR
jgi:hypothetical protein